MMCSFEDTLCVDPDLHVQPVGSAAQHLASLRLKFKLCIKVQEHSKFC